MQATQDTDRKYQLTIKLGSREFETQHHSTRAQAEEISKIAIDSDRAARGNGRDIKPRPIELVN